MSGISLALLAVRPVRQALCCSLRLIQQSLPSLWPLLLLGFAKGP